MLPAANASYTANEAAAHVFYSSYGEGVKPVNHMQNNILGRNLNLLIKSFCVSIILEQCTYNHQSGNSIDQLIWSADKPGFKFANKALLDEVWT